LKGIKEKQLQKLVDQNLLRWKEPMKQNQNSEQSLSNVKESSMSLLGYSSSSDLLSTAHNAQSPDNNINVHKNMIFGHNNVASSLKTPNSISNEEQSISNELPGMPYNPLHDVMTNLNNDIDMSGILDNISSFNDDQRQLHQDKASNALDADETDADTDSDDDDSAYFIPSAAAAAAAVAAREAGNALDRSFTGNDSIAIRSINDEENVKGKGKVKKSSFAKRSKTSDSKDNSHMSMSFKVKSKLAMNERALTEAKFLRANSLTGFQTNSSISSDHNFSGHDYMNSMANGKVY
jgi:hypothetical protein